MKKILLSLAALLAVAAVMQAQELPYDPELRKGVLENGMTYYIRHNGKPEGQAEFWIVHNVGAVREEVRSRDSPISSNTWLSTGRRIFPASG